MYRFIGRYAPEILAILFAAIFLLAVCTMRGTVMLFG
jgi:hypothetical protein